MVRNATDAATFLESWVGRFIEGRTAEEIDAAVSECVAEALRYGLGRDEIRAAAGGAVLAYVREAILRRN